MALLASATARAEGPGLKVSDTLVMHLGAALGLGYDTNVFYTGDTPQAPNVGAFYLSFRPSLDLATNPPQRGGDTPHGYDFRLSAALPLRFLLSSDPGVNGHYSIGAEGGLLLRINPMGVWSFDLFDTFVRTSVPPYGVVSAATQNAQAGNINSDQNQAGFRLAYKPGGGRIETQLQYTNGVNYYENNIYTSRSLLTNDFQLRVRWNFFPKTGLYINLAETTNNYVLAAQDPATTPPAAYPLRAVVGLIGLITPRLSLNFNIGYGNSFTQSNAKYTGNSYSNVIALAEIEWRPTLLTQLKAGYRHDFAQALIGTYYIFENAYAGLSQVIWRFNLALNVAYQHSAYQGDLQPYDFVDGRVDDLLGARIQLDLPIRDYLTISVGDDLAKNWSNCVFTSAGSNVCSYLRDDVWLRVAFAY